MVQDLFDLTGRVAAVTGASSGIGQAIARALAGAGASVVCVARREGALAETVRMIAEAGGEAAPVVGDLADHHDAERIAATMADPFGGPDILVNAAGINLRQPPDAITPESWDRTLALNLSTPFFLARTLVPAMRDRGWGRVINIASLQSSRAFPNSMPYGASKGAVAQLTRAMAEAWSKDGITCNAIAPGFFPTELTAAVFDDAEAAERNARQTAIGRNGRLEDLHGVAIFLAAPASDYVTGQIIHVDGGFTAK
ncbi:MAG: SDR family oxidoreductase [Inquilinus sp.]|nr:SDR family oxidoreductase [Inquilinus sp.]